VDINPITGLLAQCQYLPSPHCNERPNGGEIDLIVIHGISLPAGEFGHSYIEDFFCGKLDFAAHPDLADIKDLRVSAHLLIKRNGEVVQFVPFIKRAWHAGVSSFAGRSGCNDYSIGIELEGTDDIAYEAEQYEQLAKIIKALKIAYSAISNDRIVGHDTVAPGRKTDPGPAFVWDYLHCLLIA
jgi:AmpD protein